MLPGPAPQPPGIDDELPLPPPLPTTSAFAALLERKELLDHGAVGNVFRARMSGVELVLKEAKGEASATSVAREAQAAWASRGVSVLVLEHCGTSLDKAPCRPPALEAPWKN